MGQRLGLTLLLLLIPSMSNFACSSSRQASYAAPSHKLDYASNAQAIQNHEVRIASSAGTEGTQRAFAPEPGAGGAGDRKLIQHKRKTQQIDSRKLVRNGYLTVEVDDESDFDALLSQVASLGETVNGYVSERSDKSITILVPGEYLDNVVDSIEALGEIVERSFQVQDVTLQYVDLQTQIQNLEALQARLRALLDRATNVEEVLAVEKELNRVTGELDRLKGRMRVMNRDTTYASLRVYAQKSVTPGPLGWVFYGTYRAIKWLFVWD